ncbi:hypothetical protein D2V93_09520 [Flagellimonas taeanensis]|jgi:uncharacterized protein (UPF0335 family)|uniref:LTXXQ motif family protein n=1 Tax=Flagellimonas taeanensis TaxID=1005926 RepID=A0A1M6VCD2_9FLAO|nr:MULTISPECIES: hypothetical protein [Allomuricauda]MDC6385625.1 hypothetical protein [Muricauda sp. SK9]MEE1963299.1 hypothetical protein [Allomuricauda taeanensis]RIV51079.1 hypothetical protein D2V93_09520 [Allomuricauda taeanensis]SFC18881.1 hypothetical protein SAMN04487891_10730 [Allomuricauda taeanensis]SHK79041.1 hypothetical protein SAMN05216293_1978 [Allomuricauda taeanensis]
MKRIQTLFFLAFLLGLFSINDLVAQYGYGSPYGYGSRYGRQRNMVPQAGPTESKKDETPPTAEEIVDDQMPSITEALGLDPFEQAVVRTSLVQSVQQRIELQILQLEPLQMKEEIEKIERRQNEELKAGLPEDKYNAFLELQENRFNTKKVKKKKKKKD